MTIQDALAKAQIDQLDAEVLLSALLQVDRSYLLSHPEDAIPDVWHDWQQRRLAGEPVAYIVGKKEFYGRDFIVSPDVLIPRPSTEQLVKTTLDVLTGKPLAETNPDTDIVITGTIYDDLPDVTTIVDVGTGSGCIAITLGLETNKKIVATDTSQAALNIAKENATVHQVEIDCRLGSLLAPILDIQEPFLIVSNPPYIPNDEQLMNDVLNYEPHQALFGGVDGANLVRKLRAQADSHPFCRGCIVECRVGQWM